MTQNHKKFLNVKKCNQSSNVVKLSPKDQNSFNKADEIPKRVPKILSKLSKIKNERYMILQTLLQNHTSQNLTPRYQQNNQDFDLKHQKKDHQSHTPIINDSQQSKQYKLVNLQQFDLFKKVKNQSESKQDNNKIKQMMLNQRSTSQPNRIMIHCSPNSNRNHQSEVYQKIQKKSNPHLKPMIRSIYKPRLSSEYITQLCINNSISNSTNTVKNNSIYINNNNMNCNISANNNICVNNNINVINNDTNNNSQEPVLPLDSLKLQIINEELAQKLSFIRKNFIQYAKMKTSQLDTRYQDVIKSARQAYDYQQQFPEDCDQCPKKSNDFGNQFLDSHLFANSKQQSQKLKYQNHSRHVLDSKQLHFSPYPKNLLNLIQSKNNSTNINYNKNGNNKTNSSSSSSNNSNGNNNKYSLSYGFAQSNYYNQDLGKSLPKKLLKPSNQVIDSRDSLNNIFMKSAVESQLEKILMNTLFQNKINSNNQLKINQISQQPLFGVEALKSIQNKNINILENQIRKNKSKQKSELARSLQLAQLSQDLPVDFKQQTQEQALVLGECFNNTTADKNVFINGQVTHFQKYDSQKNLYFTQSISQPQYLKNSQFPNKEIKIQNAFNEQHKNNQPIQIKQNASQYQTRNPRKDLEADGNSDFYDDQDFYDYIESIKEY